MKNRIVVLYLITTLFLNFTASYLIVNILRSIYYRNYTGDYTMYMKFMDELRMQLGTIPILFWVVLGASLGIILMAVLRWIGWWE